MDAEYIWMEMENVPFDADDKKLLNPYINYDEFLPEDDEVNVKILRFYKNKCEINL